VLPHQSAALNAWINNGIVTGPSGTGKTTLLVWSLTPYLGTVRVRNSDLVRRQTELDAFFAQALVYPACF
jgi:ABC-type lipoprotein export system ATPase subunit